MEILINRFEIVRLATKLSDHETIALQAKKLREISVNDELNEIVTLLENRNYRQALFAMKAYLDDADSSFLNMPKLSKQQPKSTDATPKQPSIDEPKVDESVKQELEVSSVEPNSVIEESSNAKANNLFDLATDRQEGEKVISLDEMLRLTEESASKTVKTDQYPQNIDQYLEQTKDEILNSNSDLELQENRVSDVVKNSDEPKEQDDNKQAEKENDTEIKYSDETIEIEEKKSDIETDILSAVENADNEESTIDGEPKDIQENVEIEPSSDIDKDKNIVDNKGSISYDYTKLPEAKKYSPISYIEQKYKNMLHQFPQVEEREEGIMQEVTDYLRQISLYGYDDNDINNILSSFKSHKDQGNITEAAQLILLAAATESSLAQLLLARELYKGEILKKDLPEAFTQINRLAEHDYPEAICDLAQLYEYGHGIKKDKKTALLLYEEALEMGVERARRHIEKLRNSKPLFGGLLKI